MNRSDVGRGTETQHVGVVLEDQDAAWFGYVDVLCEKWSEEAVAFTRQRLMDLGFTGLPDGTRAVPTGKMVWDNTLQKRVEQLLLVPNIVPVEYGITSTALRAFVGEPEEVVEDHSNLLLNEGIQEMWDLIIAAGGTTAYNNANAEIGVGDSNTAAAATQTDLQAATNKLFKGMVATYPQRTNQTVDFRSDFTSGEANYAWEEWSIRNGVTRNKNMNRKVTSLGTKVTGTWTLTVSVTLA